MSAQPHKLLLAMGQMRVVGGDAEGNLARACAMIAQAARQGAQVIVLPECLDLGWMSPEAREAAQPIPGPRSGALAQAARQARLYLAAGLTERAGDSIYNAAVLISPDGELLLKHRKINELEIAHDLYSLGASVSVARTPMGALAVLICADNFPESLVFAHAAARMGARLLLSPCAWAVEADHDNAKDPYGALWLGSYTTLTQAHEITVAGVSYVGWLTGGPWKGRQCIGCSLAMGPGGAVLARGPYGVDAETLILLEVPLP